MKSLLRRLWEALGEITLSDRIFLGFLLVLMGASAAGLTLTAMGRHTFWALLKWMLPAALSLFGVYLIFSGKSTELFKGGVLALLLALVVWPAWLAGGGTAVSLLYMLLLAGEAFLLLENAVFSWCIAGLSGASAVGLLVIGAVSPELYAVKHNPPFWDVLLQTLFVFAAAAVTVYLFKKDYRRQNALACSLDEELAFVENTDLLTGVYSRRTICAVLRDTAAEPFYLAKLDIDRIWRLNDRYGSGAGDAVIAHFAAHVQGVVGNAGVMGRYGGDEFLVIFTHVTDMQVKNICEQLLWVPAWEQIPVSMSGGVVKCAGRQEERALLRRAERLVQDSKRQGRSRISLWDGQVLRTE